MGRSLLQVEMDSTASGKSMYVYISTSDCWYCVFILVRTRTDVVAAATVSPVRRADQGRQGERSDMTAICILASASY
jgi:hypothetical protein